MSENLYQNSSDRIRFFIQRLERIEEEKRSLNEGAKELLMDAKGEGLEPKILKKVVRLRQIKPQDLSHEEALIQLYMDAAKNF